VFSFIRESLKGNIGKIDSCVISVAYILCLVVGEKELQSNNFTVDKINNMFKQHNNKYITDDNIKKLLSQSSIPEHLFFRIIIGNPWKS